MMSESLQKLLRLLGFEKLSTFERDYIHDANTHGGMYIGIITFSVEIWMLIRLGISKIIPKCQEGMDLVSALIRYTTKYWLFLLVGLGLLLFCRFCSSNKNNKMSGKWFVILLLNGSLCVLYTFVIRLESFFEAGDSITPIMATIMNVLIVCLYTFLFAFGVTIVTYVLFRYLKDKRVLLLEHLVIINFALIGLVFGILVSYSDFWEEKEITCFLMMMIYVGYLLIYRPYITVIILSASFYVFYNVLLTYNEGLSFKPKEVILGNMTLSITSGDTVNYLTYLFSLITIFVAIYHGRLKEARELKENQLLFGQISEALATAIDAKDKYTHGHSTRVADYSLKLARASGKSDEECQEIYYAALLHDVGKIGVPDYIINKAGKLTDEEFAQIKLHPVHGNNILSRISEAFYLSIGAKYHHERFDGRGYPEGLKGEDIPEIARIISVADAYDAMTSKRSYRDPIPQQIVREEIVKGSGTQFDPKYAKLMQHLIDLDTEYEMKERSGVTEFAGKDQLSCDRFADTVSDGILLSAEMRTIRLKVDVNNKNNGDAKPAIIMFDSLDGRFHNRPKEVKELNYFEYAKIWYNGKSECTGARKISVESSINNKNGEFNSDNTGSYEIKAVRVKDHVQITINDGYKTTNMIIALPDSVRYVYLGLTGENCRFFDLSIDKAEEKVEDGFIPRIAEEISYINVPAGDIPNIQVNGYRYEHTEGIPIRDGMKISFHTMSLPTARLVWHCAFLDIFYSENRRPEGDTYKEYALIRLDGENWEAEGTAENKLIVNFTKDFAGWDAWHEQNKKGYDCTVSFKRHGNEIETFTENMGIVIRNTTIIKESYEDVYVALTGDQCALTNIKIQNKS